MPVIVDT